MKFPWGSVLVSFRICLAPSFSKETRAPGSGFPLLSFTEPVIVAIAVLFGVEARDSIANRAANATKDKPRPNALLMTKRPPGTNFPSEVIEAGELSFMFRLDLRKYLLQLIAASTIDRRIHCDMAELVQARRLTGTTGQGFHCLSPGNPCQASGSFPGPPLQPLFEAC